MYFFIQYIVTTSYLVLFKKKTKINFNQNHQKLTVSMCTLVPARITKTVFKE